MQKNATLSIIAIIAAAAAFIGLGAVFTVHQAQIALVLQFGEAVRAERDPGLKFKVPFIQDVVYFDKRILSLDAPPEEVINNDQRRLVVDSFARYRITDPLRFFQTVRNEQGLRGRLGPALNAALRGILGKMDAQALVSGDRPAAMNQLKAALSEEALKYGIDIVDVRIKRADFPDAISQAIFRRMQTEREREAKEQRATGFELSERIRADAERQRTILLAEARKKSEILRGEGDGERTRIFATAANQDPEFYGFYRSLQAYLVAMQSNDTTMVLSPDSEFFRYFSERPKKK